MFTALTQLPDTPAATSATTNSVPDHTSIVASPPNHPPPPRPLTTGPGLSTSEISILDCFNASENTQEQIRKHWMDFIDRHRILKKTRASLNSFSAIVHGSDGSLPRSMQLNIIKSARFPIIDGDPTFFRDAQTALRRIELTAAKEIASTMLTAKQRHVEHLTTLANPQAFLTTSVKAFTTYVNRFADDWDAQNKPLATTDTEQTATAPQGVAPTFPRQPAILHFETKLRNMITEHMTNEIHAKQIQTAIATAKAKAERAAQEDIVAGGNTHQTIADVATDVSNDLLTKTVKPLAKVVQQLQSKAARASHAMTTTLAPAMRQQLKRKAPTTSSSVPATNLAPISHVAPTHQPYSLDPVFFSTIADPNDARKRTRHNNLFSTTPNDNGSEIIEDSRPWRTSSSNPDRAPGRFSSFPSGGAPRNTQRRSPPSHRQENDAASTSIASERRTDRKRARN